MTLFVLYGKNVVVGPPVFGGRPRPLAPRWSVKVLSPTNADQCDADSHDQHGQNDPCSEALYTKHQRSQHGEQGAVDTIGVTTITSPKSKAEKKPDTAMLVSTPTRINHSTPGRGKSGSAERLRTPRIANAAIVDTQ